MVTGIGCITSLGMTSAQVTQALTSGRSGISAIVSFDTSTCRSHLAGRLTGFDPSAYIDPAKLRRIDEVGRLALACCRRTLEDGGVPLTAGKDRDATGVVLGTFTAGSHSTVEYLENLRRHGPAGVSAMSFSNTVGNAAASLCAIEYGLKGPNVTLSYKEASALAAVTYAVGLLRQRRASAIVSGGADGIEEVFFRVHDRFRVLSPIDGGDEASRPFDRRRNGFVFGEGAVGLLLERLDAARARGAVAHGEILGAGATGSPCGINEWPADASELARAMRLALEDAGIRASDISVIFASANSTPRLDPLEACAITGVFGKRRVPVVSVKGAAGEFGAAGALSVAAALLCLRQGIIPPTVGFEEPDSDCPVDVSPAARSTAGRLAMVNSFASGGTNYSVIVRAGDASRAH